MGITAKELGELTASSVEATVEAIKARAHPLTSGHSVIIEVYNNTRDRTGRLTEKLAR